MVDVQAASSITSHSYPSQLPADPSPHPWNGFLTGPENALAFASIQALAHGQREGLSPLLIHGPSGTGKSRLLAGLVAEWIHHRPTTAVAHVQGVEFAESCLAAAQRNERDGWTELHNRFRTVELLVIDDVQGLERISAAQAELVHILDAVDARGSCAALSCHTPPGQWLRMHWPTRLISRLTGGLSVRIDPPGLASRRCHLLESVRTRGLSLTAEALELLASSADGYRTLDGWLTQLTLQASLATGRSRPARSNPGASTRLLDLGTVTSLLSGETELAMASPTVEAIAKNVANRLGIRVSALRGSSRQASVAQARHIAMHLARLHTRSSFAVIGSYFGGRDPATVRYGCKAAAAHLAADPSLAAALALRLPTLR
jgi:chromosomal replication initiator protein